LRVMKLARFISTLNHKDRKNKLDKKASYFVQMLKFAARSIRGDMQWGKKTERTYQSLIKSLK